MRESEGSEGESRRVPIVISRHPKSPAPLLLPTNTKEPTLRSDRIYTPTVVKVENSSHRKGGPPARPHGGLVLKFGAANRNGRLFDRA
jgi:hypothetical protein